MSHRSLKVSRKPARFTFFVVIPRNDCMSSPTDQHVGSPIRIMICAPLHRKIETNAATEMQIERDTEPGRVTVSEA